MPTNDIPAVVLQYG